jgi:hypothetical protein
MSERFDMLSDSDNREEFNAGTVVYAVAKLTSKKSENRVELDVL